MNALTVPEFSVFENIRHGFTTRQHHVDTATWFTVKQVHGSHVVWVQKQSKPEELKTVQADALVTQEPDKVICVQTADCLPVLFYDPQQQAIGAAHAGWRGLSQGVLQETLLAMKTYFGSKPEDILSGWGPHISKCCFEVGQDVWEAFCRDDSKRERCFQKKQEGKWLADLAGLAKSILQSEGVKRIYSADSCTFCHAELFYSYRREPGKTGRHFSFMELIPSPPR